MLNNPIYITFSLTPHLEEVFALQTTSSHESSTSRQLLFNEQNGYSSRNFIPSSLCQSSASKASFGVMAIMMTSSTFLEKQIVLFAVSLETFATIKEKKSKLLS